MDRHPDGGQRDDDEDPGHRVERDRLVRVDQPDRPQRGQRKKSENEQREGAPDPAARAQFDALQVRLNASK